MGVWEWRQNRTAGCGMALDQQTPRTQVIQLPREFRVSSVCAEAPANNIEAGIVWPCNNYVFACIAWPTKFFPSDHIAPGTRWLSAMTDSKLLKIQSQSESEITSAGKSLIVWPA